MAKGSVAPKRSTKKSMPEGAARLLRERNSLAYQLRGVASLLESHSVKPIDEPACDVLACELLEIANKILAGGNAVSPTYQALLKGRTAVA